jgi:EAL domain-containing protein (putative c-di-GMP-specific phosphodiesterase class I)
VPPDKFIPIAEQSGLIVSIGRWVLNQACRQAADWQTEGPRTVSVNVSAVQLRDGAFVDDIQRALDDSGLDPRLLTVELTETVLVENAERACAVLESICSLGVRVAIDDFGTGFCSLAYLRKFPVDIIKIDRAFISELGDPEMHGRTLAENILDLAESLDVPTVAEGIEQTLEADRLRALSCQYGQGFLFAKPLELSDFSQLLRSPAQTSPAHSTA